MKLRKMEIEDLERILQIEQEAFSVPWSREAMQKEIEKNAQAHYLVAEEDGQPVGYSGFWQVLDEGHIMNIAVAQEARRKGIGTQLLQAMLRKGAELGILYWTLEVRVSNRAAISLYEKLGFTSAGIRPGYYEKPREDANIMWYQSY